MNYQPYDYETDTDAAPWTAAPPQAQMMAPPQNHQLVAAPGAAQPAQVIPAPVPSGASEMLALGSMIQSMQQTQMQQVYLLRDFDTRIGRLEHTLRPNPIQQAAQVASFERATWWAIWGLLMLILGGALAIVIILILMNIQFR